MSDVSYLEKRGAEALDLELLSSMLEDFDLSELISQSWLIKDYFPDNSIMTVTGKWGTGKTTSVIDIDTHIGSGLEWLGNRICRPGPVFYIAGEAHRAVARRFNAACQDNGILPSDARIRMSHLPADLGSLKGQTAAIDAMKRLQDSHGALAKVTVDTLTANIGPGRSSSDQKDMGMFLHACHRIRDEMDCSVWIIHHPGHNTGNRSKGSSDLLGDVDAEYIVEPDGGGVMKFHIPSVEKGGKFRVGPIPDPLYFKLVGIDLLGPDGNPIRDAEGQTVSEACVEWLSDHVSTGKEDKAFRWTPSRATARDTLEDVLQSDGRPAKDVFANAVMEREDVHPDERVVPVDTWRERAYAKGISNSEKQGSRQQAFNRAAQDLKGNNVVDEYEGICWIKPKNKWHH